MNSIKSRNIWMILSIVLFFSFLSYMYAFPPTKANNEAVAKVNGVEISKDQLYQEIVGSSGKQALDSMIDKELIRQEAAKASIQITDADIEQELATVKQGFPSEEEFTQALGMYGMTLDGLKKELTTQVTLRKLLEPQIQITDEDIKKYYDENLEMLKTPEQVQASHILVATKEEAEAVLAELQNGADFAKLAQEKSIDPGSKEKGGDLGYFAKGEMEEPFEQAAFSLEAGKLSGVVTTSHGSHIIKVTGRKAEATPALEEKKADIQKILTNEKISAMATEWITEKKNAASVENYISNT
jgi:foldase protein PrsA